MLGVEVLTWCNEQEQTDSYYNVVKNYLFTGKIGHCALKITVPSDDAHDLLIKKYCWQGESPLIAYHKVSVKVKKKISNNKDEAKYTVETIPAWEIYFSVWPNGLKEEYHDRLIENYEQEVEYSEKWCENFPVSYRERHTGALRGWVPHRVYDFIFGKPELVPEPICFILHPSDEGIVCMEHLLDCEEKHDLLLRQMEELIVKTNKVNLESLLIQNEITRLQNYLNKWNLSEEHKKAIKSEENALKLKKCKLHEDNQPLFDMLEDLVAEEEKLSRTLKEKRAMLQKYASIGRNPSQLIHLPLTMSTKLSYGLSLEPMLKCMQKIAKDVDFNIVFNNCSHAVHEVLLAGCEVLKSFMIKGNFLQFSDFYPSFLDRPSVVASFAQQLQAAIIDANKMQFANQTEKKFTQEEQKTLKTQSWMPAYGAQITAKVATATLSSESVLQCRSSLKV